jgi:hypothetical protein
MKTIPYKKWMFEITYEGVHVVASYKHYKAKAMTVDGACKVLEQMILHYQSKFSN